MTAGSAWIERCLLSSCTDARAWSDVERSWSPAFDRRWQGFIGVPGGRWNVSPQLQFGVVFES